MSVLLEYCCSTRIWLFYSNIVVLLEYDWSTRKDTAPKWGPRFGCGPSGASCSSKLLVFQAGASYLAKPPVFQAGASCLSKLPTFQAPLIIGQFVHLCITALLH